MKILSLVFNLSRPRFWLYTAGPFIVGAAFAVHDVYQLNTPAFWIGLLFFLIPANMYLYGVNDLADEDTDEHNTKKTSHEIKLAESNKRIYIVSIMISIATLLLLQSVFSAQSFLLTSIFMGLATMYSLPPIRLKARPYLDFLSNILYVVPGLVGYSLFTGQLPPLPIIVACGAWTGAMHLYSAIPDIQSDTQAKLQTTAVLLGRMNSLWLCFVLWSICAIIVAFYSPFFVFILVYPFLTLRVIIGQLDLTGLYWRFPWINGIIGFILFWYAIFS
ncbi:MAG: prenyltransferase [Weeksellaceae bacterium]